MQTGRTENANANNAKKRKKNCNIQGKNGDQGRSKWFKNFRRRLHPFFLRHKMQQEILHENARKCKKMEKMQQKNATTQRKMQNGPKCKKKRKNTIANLPLPCLIRVRSK